MYKKLILLILLVMLIFPTVVLADCDTTKDGRCVYHNYKESVTSCGNGKIENIPTLFPKVTSIIYNVLLVSVPILLVALGMFDLLKAMSSGKEDDIKKNQSIFIKRIIMGVGVFGVFLIVRIVVSVAADNSGNIMKCADCFITNKCG